MTTFGQSWSSQNHLPEELGHIAWNRNYNEALQKALKSDKPIFILFQEVPGCSTCKNYGNNILTHPHIVEAIESYFIPLAIYNNKGGEDAKILNKFGEPTWNNPVVRIIDGQTERDLVERLSGKYDMASLIQTIIDGLLADHKIIPSYLDLLSQEHQESRLLETHLSMFCFWSGEKNLGNLDGVIATQAGFMNGSEVVKVRFDPKRLNEEKLMKFAYDMECADAVFTNDQRQIEAANNLKIKIKKEGNFRADAQPKYFIYQSRYRFLPMTSIQALRVNSALSKGINPDEYLSPRQLEYLSLMEKKQLRKREAIDKDFSTLWNTEIYKK